MPLLTPGTPDGAHDRGHASGLGCAVKFIHRRAFLPPAIAQGFEAHVQADLVAIIESVHDSTCLVGHANLHPLYDVFYHAQSQGRPGESHDAQERVVNLRQPCLGADGRYDHFSARRWVGPEVFHQGITDGDDASATRIILPPTAPVAAAGRRWAGCRRLYDRCRRTG